MQSDPEIDHSINPGSDAVPEATDSSRTSTAMTPGSEMAAVDSLTSVGDDSKAPTIPANLDDGVDLEDGELSEEGEIGDDDGGQASGEKSAADAEPTSAAETTTAGGGEAGDAHLETKAKLAAPEFDESQVGVAAVPSPDADGGRKKKKKKKHRDEEENDETADSEKKKKKVQ